MQYTDCPQLVRDFLSYMEFIKGRSKTTIKAYYTDLKTFFRFIKKHKNLVDKNINFNEINIADIDADIIKTITLSDVYEFLLFVSSERSNNSKSRARKVSCIKVFFKYLTNNVNIIKENPVENLESPKIAKTLPKYLTLEDCISLLNAIDGDFKERDFCIITLFLNCGMRLSELVGINLDDIRNDTLLLRGKGNKERIIYLNQACVDALTNYLQYRNSRLSIIKPDSKNALFIGKNGNRIGARRVEMIVNDMLKKAGLDGQGYSVHKLRHTAATMMYQHGNVDVRVLQEILGHANLGTTQIYTHISNNQIKNAINSTPLSNIKVK